MYDNYKMSHISPNFETYDVIWWRHSLVNTIRLYTVSSNSKLSFDALIVLIDINWYKEKCENEKEDN